MNGCGNEKSDEVKQRKCKEKRFRFNNGEWEFVVVNESPILSLDGREHDEFMCGVRIPQLPDMVQHGNRVSITHTASGASISCSPLAALAAVSPDPDPMGIKVHQSADWLQARAGSQHIDNVIKPFDWTFTTRYSGDLSNSGGGDGEAGGSSWRVEETEEDFDWGLLRRRDPILFSASVPLFEDELGDNGCASASIRLRVMPSNWFMLQTFYLRVDKVIVRVFDTRWHFVIGSNYVLKEISHRQSLVSQLSEFTVSNIQNPDLIRDKVPQILVQRHKLYFSQNSNQSQTETETIDG